MFHYFPQLGKLRVQSAGQIMQEEIIIYWGFFNCPTTGVLLGTTGSQMAQDDHSLGYGGALNRE